MENAIEVSDFTFSYLTVDGYVRALEKVSVSIKTGEFVAIIGPVGAGKTTFCRSITGLIPHFYTGHSDGSVRIKGKESKDYSIASLASTVGFVFQSAETQIVRMTVGDEVAFGPENLAVDAAEIDRRIAQSLELVGLKGFEARPTFALSGGQKQRLTIASILSTQPSIFVLDEPTSELDPQGTVEVYEVLLRLNKELGKTMVLVEQKADLIAGVADRVIVLDGGKVVDEGTPREIFSKRPAELLERGVRIPEVCQLASMFADGSDFPLSVEEGRDYFSRLLERRSSGRRNRTGR